MEKVDNISSNGLTVTYQGTENGLKMSDQNGNSYDAKFDGKEYPINGDPGKTMVSLKRRGAIARRFFPVSRTRLSNCGDYVSGHIPRRVMMLVSIRSARIPTKTNTR